MDATKIKRVLARTSLSALTPLLRRFVRERCADGFSLDPQVALLAWLGDLLGEPRTHEQPVPVARRTFVHQTGIVDLALPPEVTVEDLWMETPDAARPARIYRTSLAESGAPALVYYHGGGFVLGGLQSHDGVCRWLSREARITVIAIDYRLAPEHPFPAAVEDGLAAYRWAMEHRKVLGISALGVGGDSAGGCLAAVTCQQAKMLGLPQPALQLLIYPVTHVGSTLPSRKTFEDGVFLEKATLDWFTGLYLPDPSTRSDPRASPLLADRLDGLAPALVLTAGFDPLRDEGKAYADRLREAGVPVEYYCATTLPHGFWSMGGVIEEARRWVLRISRKTGALLRRA
ncbi:MAG: alpha/beta hydrolase [Myxococcales bacterium]|nr:alpha/beta hydrolase [Polyangiaceae bacterium]MDW8250688.1 alpha/beta hydrolase [Myxococcales bacterium]